jgi:hypothetical protein
LKKDCVERKKDLLGFEEHNVDLERLLSRIISLSAQRCRTWVSLYIVSLASEPAISTSFGSTQLGGYIGIDQPAASRALIRLPHVRILHSGAFRVFNLHRDG